MKNLLLYKITRYALLLLLICGVAIWFFVRAPRGTSAGAIYQDVELIGRARLLTDQAVSVIDGLAKVDSNMKPEEVIQKRAAASFINKSIEALELDFKQTESRWIPVKDWEDLLSRCRRHTEIALQKTDSHTLAIESPDENTEAESNVDLETIIQEKQADVAPVLEEIRDDLSKSSKKVGTLVELSIEKAMCAKGLFLGFSVRDWLLGLVVLISFIGIAGCFHT